MRTDGRNRDEIREIKIEKNFLKDPDGSVLISLGNTKVICTAMIEEKVPFFIKGQGKGWITAEYSMLPGSTKERKQRDITKGKIDGRTQEIQRLIGRSLRTAIDLNELGERTIWVDCDVIQADGGTRVTSITGAFIAIYISLEKLKEKGLLKEIPIKHFISAISVGTVDNEIMLDLNYKEDFNADVDMNIVMTDKEEIIEIQGTGEKNPFRIEELSELMSLAKIGNRELIKKQKEVLNIE